MRKQSGIIIDQIIDLIESHLDENMDLHTIAGDFNYLNTIFTVCLPQQPAYRCMNMQSDGD